jgi:hypothetical protein
MVGPVKNAHFLVFTASDGVTVTNALLCEGQLTNMNSFRVFLSGSPVDTLNDAQFQALVGILRRTIHPAKEYHEAVFYDGNWWAETHSGTPLGGCAKVLFRVGFAA